MAEQDPVTVVVTPAEPVIETHIIPDRPRKVYAGMWGPPEIGVIAAGAMSLLAVLAIYFFWVIPSNRELETNRAKADSLEAEVLSARAKYGEITDTQTQVDRLLTSVDDFETRFLPAVSNGQNALYQRLNGLIVSNGLVNTAGPDYAPLDTADANNTQQSDDEKGRSKFRSLYPGVYVTMTVEGSYQSLRRFIRDIETGNEFVVISSVELAPSDNSDAVRTTTTQTIPGARPAKPGAAQPGFQPNPMMMQPQFQVQRQPGKMHGEIIALHIELAAYFRRPNFAPMAPAAQ
jgi:Tfp pilus assembly protein PilO